MASGSFNVSSSNQFIVSTCWWSSVPNTAGNYSDVSISFTAQRTNSYTTWGSGNYKLNINGNEINPTITITQASPIKSASAYTIGTHSVRVYHNTDGTASIPISCYLYLNSPLTLGTTTQWVALDNIPRTSVPTITNSGWASMGVDTLTIYTNRASTAFTHEMQYSFGGIGFTTFATGVTDSVGFCPPIALANQIPNASWAQGTIRCHTFNGATHIGYSDIPFCPVVPSTVVPTFTSVTAARVNGSVPSGWAEYIQSYSKATLTINGAAGAYSSTITGYSITGQNLNVSASSGTTDFLSASGTFTYTATITDSRGRTASKTCSITVQAYFAPSVDGSALRCTSGAVTSESGTYYKVLPTASFAPCNGKNTITLTTAFKRASDSTYSTAATLTNNVWSGALGANTISVENSYDIKLTVTDGLNNTASTVLKVTSLYAYLSFKKGLKGFAAGKYMDTADLIDLAMDTRITGKLNVVGSINAVNITATGSITAAGLTVSGKTMLDRTYPVGSVYTSVSSTSPATLFGGTWLQIAGQFPLAWYDNITQSGGGFTSNETALSEAQMPSHRHTNDAVLCNAQGIGTSTPVAGGSTYGYAYSGGLGVSWTGSGWGHAHYHEPPWYKVYMWRRTA